MSENIVGQDTVITSKQAAELLGLHYQTVSKKARQGILPLAGGGGGRRGVYLFWKQDILKYKEERNARKRKTKNRRQRRSGNDIE